MAKKYGKFTYIDIEDDFTVLWGREECGWGEFTFFPKEGEIHCDNECMSKEFLKETLCELVDRSEFRWDEKKEFKDKDESLSHVVKVVKTYEFYDIPRLFIGRDIMGNYYMVLSIEETKDELTWLYSKLDLWVLFKLEGSVIEKPTLELYTFFKENENSFIVRQNQEDEISIKRITDIPDKWLPEKGVFLKNNKEE